MLFLLTADGYKQKVERAFLAAQEILGSLTVASERVATDTEHKVEEVEVKCYDSDSLSSPPPSSEESDKDSDPLLDFSRDDDLTHNPVTAGPAMVRRAIEAQRALEGMQSITRGVQEKRQRKEEKSRLVSTQTEFTPLFSKGENVGRHPQPLKETSQQVQAEKQPSGAASSSQQSSGAASSTQQSSGASSSSQQSSGAASSSQQSSGASSSSQQSHRVIPETSQHSLPPISHHSLPPPIPPYSPERPDSFLLSNKPEYHHSVSTKHEQLAPHPKQVDKEDVMVLTAGARPPAPLNVALRTKRKGAEPLPTPEQEGHVADLERKQTSFVPQVVPTATEVTDIYEEAACKGLPGSGERVCRSLVWFMSSIILCAFPSACLAQGGGGCVAETAESHPLSIVLAMLRKA